jgi:predicted transcriptional regulator
MVENKVGALPVKDDSGNIVGIITERDLMREVHAYTDLEARPVQSVMTANIISGTREDGIDTILEQMIKNRFRHVPILEKGRLVGIISIGDLVKSQLRPIPVLGPFCDISIDIIKSLPVRQLGADCVRVGFAAINRRILDPAKRFHIALRISK